MSKIRFSLVFVIGILSCLLTDSSSLFAQDSLKGKRVLVFTKNGEGFVHDNVDVSAQAIAGLGKKHGFKVEITDDAAVFSEDRLKNIHLVVFANTNNEVFDNDQQRLDFRRFIQAGGGMLGIHSALGTERNWTWFSQLKGGTFVYHPSRQDLYLTKIVDHPSTQDLPTDWKWYDECYFSDVYYPGIQNLMVSHLDKLNEKEQPTIAKHKTSFGDLHPVVWHQKFDGGTLWMTTLGHEKSAYSDPVFLTHLLGGLEYVASQVEKLDYTKASAKAHDEEVKY